jgi:hypothetical protein
MRAGVSDLLAVASEEAARGGAAQALTRKAMLMAATEATRLNIILARTLSTRRTS